MKKNLIIGVNETQEKDIKSEFQSSSNLRARLIEMLQDKKDSALKQNISATNYESPSWAYKQADIVGYMRAIDEMCELLK